MITFHFIMAYAYGSVRRFKKHMASLLAHVVNSFKMHQRSSFMTLEQNMDKINGHLCKLDIHIANIINVNMRPSS
jgi:NTP pyrophosphatase (non-canonical NTP hydrolase)